MFEYFYYLLFNFSLSCIATLCFAIILNAPKKDLLYCTLPGGIGWLVYSIIFYSNINPVTSTLAASLTVAYFSRVFSYTRQAPATIFLISGIIPLVPGITLYKTMTAVLAGNMYGSYIDGVLAFKLAGVIALGIVIIFAMPAKTFSIIKPKK